VIKIAPGVYRHKRGGVTISVDELDPNFDYREIPGMEGFHGFVGSPEFERHWREQEGGPPDPSGIPRRDPNGFLLDDIFDPPEFDRIYGADGWTRPLHGDLEAFGMVPAGGWLLVNFTVFRIARDHCHYRSVLGAARTRERAMELHWISGDAPIMFEQSAQLYLFRRRYVVLRVGGRRWPD